MIASFKDKASEVSLWRCFKTGQKGMPSSPWRVATRKLDQLDSVLGLEELKITAR